MLLGLQDMDGKVWRRSWGTAMDGCLMGGFVGFPGGTLATLFDLEEGRVLQDLSTTGLAFLTALHGNKNCRFLLEGAEVLSSRILPPACSPSTLASSSKLRLPQVARDAPISLRQNRLRLWPAP